MCILIISATTKIALSNLCLEVHDGPWKIVNCHDRKQRCCARFGNGTLGCGTDWKDGSWAPDTWENGAWGTWTLDAGDKSPKGTWKTRDLLHGTWTLGARGWHKHRKGGPQGNWTIPEPETCLMDWTGTQINMTQPTGAGGEWSYNNTHGTWRTHERWSSHGSFAGSFYSSTGETQRPLHVQIGNQPDCGPLRIAAYQRPEGSSGRTTADRSGRTSQWYWIRDPQKAKDFNCESCAEHAYVHPRNDPYCNTTDLCVIPQFPFFLRA